MPPIAPRRWTLALVVAPLAVLATVACAGCGSAVSKSAASGTRAPDAATGNWMDAASADVADAADAGPQPLGDGGTEFAPYFPAWTFGGRGYAYTSLTNMQQLSGVNDVTLAFVLADPDGGCTSDLASDGIQDNLADIRAFIAAGGHVKLSFGGAQGLYLQDPTACSNATDLANAIGSVIDATGITDLDFDVEQPFDSGMSDQANQNLGQALASLQKTKHVEFGLTLMVNSDVQDDAGGGGPPGLDSQAQLLVGEVADAGAQIGRLNVMVMSLGSERLANDTEAQGAIRALTGAQAQLRTMVPGLTEAQAWHLLGATAEIGVNDNSGEVFTPDDATTLAKFALSQNLGLVSFWSIDRDRVCSGQCGFQKYSTVNASNFQFAKAFLAVLR
jgi:chitinase